MIALYISLGILILLIAHFTVIYFIFLRFFGRMSVKRIDKSTRSTSYSKPYVEEIFSYREEVMNYPYIRKEITSFDGLKLTGYYYDNHSKKVIILSPGFHAQGFTNFAYQIKYFIAHHYNVLLINQRAHEGSEGKYSTYGQKESRDILAWIDLVSQDDSIEEIYLYGISMGATSIAYASRDITNPKVKFLIMESAFTSVTSLTNHIIKSQHIPSFFFERTVRFLARKLAGVKWKDNSTVESLKENHIPSIFVHGTKDIVAIDSFFEDNYNNCLSNKYKIIVDGAPHALCALHDKEKYLNQLETIIGEKQ